jgi:hypothetical protein
MKRYVYQDVDEPPYTEEMRSWAYSAFYDRDGKGPEDAKARFPELTDEQARRLYDWSMWTSR